VPVGAAQFVAQGPALRSLVDCEDFSLPLVTQSTSVTDGEPATDSSSSGPWHGRSTAKSDSSPFMNGHGKLNGYVNQGHSSRQQDGGLNKHADAVGLPNGVHRDVVSSPSHLSNGEQSAKQAESSGGRDNSDGAVGSTGLPPEQLLGLHPNAAAAREPRLPGIGPLLPAWRSLTEAMAPVFHPVRARAHSHISALCDAVYDGMKPTGLACMLRV